MSDYIKREDAIDAIEMTDWYHQNRNKDMVLGANSAEHQAWYKAQDVYAAINSVSAADVVERKKGLWEGGDYPYMTEINPLGRNEHYWYSCSICKRGQGWKSPYCPHCGADMREPPKEVDE